MDPMGLLHSDFFDITTGNQENQVNLRTKWLRFMATLH